jgi:hypothetical protein
VAHDGCPRANDGPSADPASRRNDRTGSEVRTFLYHHAACKRNART